MNQGTGTVHNPPCFAQTPPLAVSSHRNETETGYHVTPAGGLSEDLLQELDQHSCKQKIMKHKLFI